MFSFHSVALWLGEDGLGLSDPYHSLTDAINLPESYPTPTTPRLTRNADIGLIMYASCTTSGPISSVVETF